MELSGIRVERWGILYRYSLPLIFPPSIYQPGCFPQESGKAVRALGVWRRGLNRRHQQGISKHPTQLTCCPVGSWVFWFQTIHHHHHHHHHIPPLVRLIRFHFKLSPWPSLVLGAAPRSYPVGQRRPNPHYSWSTTYKKVALVKS